MLKKTNKTYYKKGLILLALFLAFVFDMNAQNDSIIDPKLTKNSEGTEFWLCFMKNYKEPERSTDQTKLYLELFITGDKDAKVTIEIKSIGFTKEYFVAGKTVKNIIIDELAQVRSYEVKEIQQAVHISSDNPISVYGLNRRYQTTDTYLGLPVEVIGTEYRIMSYSITDEFLSQCAIVATENNTEVIITPTVETLSDKPAGQPFIVTLNKGDIYQFAGKPKVVSRLKCDLTGTHIKSNKKIAVFSGHQCAYVPVSPPIMACNHLVEQIPPVQSWGKHFYLGKLKTRSFYTYRILAHYPKTKVFEDNQLVKVLEPGEFYESKSNKNIQITANMPVLTAQYSQGYKNGDLIGDPMMLLISPTQQFIKKYRFATPVNGEWEHIVNVVAPTKSIPTLKLDGKRVDSAQFVPLGISRYSIAFINVPFGTHVMEADMPFGLYSYGFGYGSDAFDAYGTMGGQSFMDYEPAKDTINPIAELAFENDKAMLIIRDDGIDDTGIKDFLSLESSNIEFNVPAYTEGITQLKIDLGKSKTAGGGKLVFKVNDMALNSSVYTLCYVLDGKTGKYTFVLNKGDNISCESDPGYWFGAFGKYSFGFHDASFGKIGDFAADGKFSEANGAGGYFGFVFSRKFYNNFDFSAKLSFDTYGGTLSAPDTLNRKVKDEITGQFKNFQEAKEIELSGMFMNISAGVDYHFHRNLYALAGFNLTTTLSKTIDCSERILAPSDRAYPNGSNSRSLGEKTADELRTFRLGIYVGLGFNVQFYNNYYAFIESTYNPYLMGLTSDWTYNQLSFILGIKYRLF